MRLQLTARRTRVARIGCAAAAIALAVVAAPRRARAQVATFDTTHTVFYESPSHSHMFVYTPGGTLEVAPTEWLAVRASWQADVVSGASVAVKAGPAYAATHPGADVITTASVRDVRNSAHGGFTLRNQNVSLTGGYAYSTENDYKSNAVDVAARTDLFEHDTQLEIAYAHGFDRVCDRVQSAVDPAPRWHALEDSGGCFGSTNALRTTRPVDTDGLQGTWSQAWTPIFVTQLVYTAQIVHGFQSNPYRSVILGEGLKAQEHEPDNRTRESVSLRGNLWLRPIRAALRVGLRGYWDTWSVRSGTIDAELEKYLGESLRAMVRARLYDQTGALFWSDDYTGGDPPLGPKGQYWTGDRELSPFWSWLAGARLTYVITPRVDADAMAGRRPRVLGIMTSLKLAGSFDLMNFHYDEFTLGGQPIENARAYVGTLSLTALF